MLIKNDDILKKLSKEKDVPYELLRILFNDFWQQILMHLQHPENNFYKGILIRDCIKFRLNPKQLAKSYVNSLRYPRQSGYTTNLLTTHLQLKENGIYTEAQKEFIQNAERDYLSTTREERYYSDEEE